MDPTVITAIAAFFTALNGWTVGTVILCIFVLPPVLGLDAVLKIVGAMAVHHWQASFQSPHPGINH